MALYELQKIDSQVDEINKVKGELPLEVQDLEDEIEGLNTRIENINAEIEEFCQCLSEPIPGSMALNDRLPYDPSTHHA